MSITIALAGNPNSGKTTLFNALTGSNQYVGNWPGVTVEKKEGHLKGNKDVVIMDLPGIYSLSPYTLEEVIARNYLIDERPDAIINIVDGTNLGRNLYLSTQLAEIGIPMIVAVNMIDIIEKTGDKIDTKGLSSSLGCEVVEISALRGSGVNEAVNAAIKNSKSTELSPQFKFSPEVESVISLIEDKLLSDIAAERRRWFAIKIFERDEKIREKLSVNNARLSQIEDKIKKCEEELGDDSESITTFERYSYIDSVIKDCVKSTTRGKLSTSDKIDKVVTNRILALPIFVIVMFIVYFVSISTIGGVLTDWANDGMFGDGWHFLGIGSSDFEADITAYADEFIFIDDITDTVEAAANAGIAGAADILSAIKEGDFGAFEEKYDVYGKSLTEHGFDITGYVDAALESDEVPDASGYGVWIPGIPVLVESGLETIGCADWLKSLILDGIVGGVGAVLGFVPQILVLFIFLAFLEGCGYMVRIAFIMDRIFRKFGLSGKSFIPILIGTGCAIPGIMASRTIESEKDRRMTIITTSFIPCGAKLPIIALITGTVFGGAWWVAPSAYFIGIAAITCTGIILKKTKPFASDSSPFVMELPSYHLPTASYVLRSMWERGWSFIKRAGTVILLASLIIWAGSCFGLVGGRFMFDPDMTLENSVLGLIGGTISWIFAPLGFFSIKATVATIMGLVAKEEIVAVFGVLDFESMTRLAGFSFLIFNLLCAPCFAAMGAIRREMNNSKWFWFAVGYQCGFAYVISLMVYQFGMMFTGRGNAVGIIFALLLLIAFLYLLFRKPPTALASRDTARKPTVKI